MNNEDLRRGFYCVSMIPKTMLNQNTSPPYFMLWSKSNKRLGGQSQRVEVKRSSYFLKPNSIQAQVEEKSISRNPNILINKKFVFKRISFVLSMWALMYENSRKSGILSK